MKNKKKELGQFFTNSVIAEYMVDLCVDSNTDSLLDPAVGLGIFTQNANNVNDSIKITACEIDKEIIDQFKKENTYSCNLIEQDYLLTDFEDKYDCIICNPPYNKFQAIPNRKILISLFKEKYNISINGYSNICVYFLIKSMNELAKGGKCCYIIPYEFLNTGYGRVIKKYLLKSGMLKQIIKFDNKMSLFDEAITTSCIILLDNSDLNSVELINIVDIDEIKTKHYSNKKVVLYSDMDENEKWLNYFDDNNEIGDYNYKNLVDLSLFGKVSRGIATGNNNYFALNSSLITKNKLSKDVCMPCLTKAPDVEDVVFTNESFEKMVNEDKKIFLFNGQNARTKEDELYIKYGEKNGVDKAYLTSHRKPWFAIESKKAAPILICVFSRDKIKVIRNETQINNLTTFHALHLLNTDREWANLFFCYLITPTAQKILRLSRREYGDGLVKFEPNDLNNAKMLDLTIVNKDDIAKINRIYNKIKKENKLVEIDELDSIFNKYIIN